MGIGIIQAEAASGMKNIAAVNIGTEENPVWALAVDLAASDIVDVSTLATEVTLSRLVDGTTGLNSGENHIGEISRASIEITPALTVDTAAYAAGDCVGGKLTLTDALRVNGGAGTLQHLFVIDRSGTQKPALEVLLFNADPSSSTLTDQAAVSIHANDVGKIIGRISILGTKYVLTAGIYTAHINDLGSPILQATAGSKNLYAAIVATAAHDFVASTDLSLKFGIIRD